ncbi:MAG: hypothetical protein QG574_4234 [Cyanobacteriota bacterium erpe_2018_sw_21hr_WHONDRS-SW48-000092_B_bin.40]|jgi:hypothetical protein|nr:hypothetical protein [Cyanobacteriota bacterium erpe_2018_sw_21hr_WHONDRS-SW48-000092_B_bin.40]
MLPNPITNKAREQKLGRLEKVDLRTVWISESSDFTPWLANDENISLLGESIGIELEVEAREQNVGPFKADILCKEPNSGNWVLIENQLEKTDHLHLGQLLTYAAGLNAVTIVWVAQAFTDEHRAALDWLNTITGEDIRFFGIEIELWRIGESVIAPKFNTVCKPNNFVGQVSEAAQHIVLTETKQLQLEYWTEFFKYVSKNNKLLKATKPLPQHWAHLAIGTSEAALNATVNTREKRITATLILQTNAKENFALLRNELPEIEKEIGSSLEWRELPDNKQSYVVLTKQADPADRTNWLVQHKWLCDTLDSFYRAFSPRLKQMRRSNDRQSE